MLRIGLIRHKVNVTWDSIPLENIDHFTKY